MAELLGLDDDDLASLSKLKLKRITVLETRVTDKGLDQLYGMKSLSRVELSLRQGIIAFRVRRLRKNLPDAIITVKIPNPVADM